MKIEITDPPSAAETSSNESLEPPPDEDHLLRLACGDVDLNRAEVRYKDAERCVLSRRETELLRYLHCRRGLLVSRDEILEHVWQVDPRKIITRTIDMHVSSLRRKLRDDSRNPSILKTINGRGYLLV